MVITSQVDCAFVSEGKALEEVDENPTAEHGIFSPRKSAQKLVACSEDNELFLAEVFLYQQVSAPTTSLTGNEH